MAKKKDQPKEQLSVSMTEAMSTYIHSLNGQKCNCLYQATINVVERQLLEFSLRQADGNVSAAAKLLGISRTTLTRKIAAHKLTIRQTHANQKRAD